MKKLFILILLPFSTLTYAKVNIIVSVQPQQAFVQAIGGDKVSIELMVKPGNSPHTYEPKPSQMISVSKADIYFSIGVGFENVWMDRFANQNRNMKIVNVSNGIQKISIKKHSHDNHNKAKKESLDPHIWTNPKNVKTIAKTIYQTLIEIDSANKKYYQKNYADFIELIEQTDTEIKNIFKDLEADTKFMVFHPSWGYFAKQYNLIQMPIEVEGKSPKPKAILKLILEAKKQNIQAILASPEFSDEIARQIASELGIKVLKISSLSLEWSSNLINLARIIANK